VVSGEYLLYAGMNGRSLFSRLRGKPLARPANQIAWTKKEERVSEKSARRAAI
jgi:hypothetical protein